MKTRIMFLFLATLILVGQLVAQTPQAFKYQAAIRDADGQMLMEQPISLRISILKGDTLGEVVYTEIHDVITDNMGLVNLCIGEGLTITGSLSDIQWGEDKYFTQVEMDMEGGMNYQLLGTSQLMAVPYALYAERAGNIQWKETENGICYENGRVGIGTNSPVTTLDVHGHANFSSNTTFGSGNYIGLYLNGANFDDQPEWLINGHSTGKFQIRHYNGTDWEDHYLKIKPDDGFYFGASGPKLKYSFRGFIDITDSLKVGNGNFTVSNSGYLHLTGDGSPDPMLTLQNNSQTRITALSAINKKYYQPQFEGMRARGSIDNPQDLQPGDCILSLSARPYFDGEYRQSADISFYTGANPGINSYPAYISFQTTKPNDTIRYERMRITEDGRVGIGTEDPGAQKLFVATNAYGDDRAIAHFRNENNSTKSLCNVYISSGDSGSTYLNFTAPSYIHQGGKYKMHSILGNNGKGLVFRSGQNDEGRFAFEFRREMGSTYTYDEKVSITYEGNMGIGTTNPASRLHILADDNSKLLQLEGYNPSIIMTDINNYKTWQINTDNHNSKNNFRILEDGQEEKARIYIAEGGNVGVGTTDPESKLDVQGRNIELADYVFLGRMYSGTDLLLGHNIKAIDYENTRGAYVANDWPLGYSGIRMYNGTIQFHAKGGYVYEGELASNELMRIVSNGNVGIGTTDPQRKLHINDVMRLEPSFAPPENPSEGDIYMDGIEHVLKVYDGSEWKSCW